ncbi:hypothetical protein [Streptomyces sp. NPDC047043]|uniref:hypothetical protein n=1 Tax=Streptomyces sp. NPDC047043 TaxID=3154497 RepID=UPI0033C51CD0
MARQQSSSTTLPEPLRTAASALRRVPGAGAVSRAAEGALDKVGAVSPRGRRLAVYTGAGVLGVAGIVEWPVAITGAAVAWLTQPRPEERERPEGEFPAGGEGGIPAAAVPAGAERGMPAGDMGEIRAGEVREEPSGDVGTTPGVGLGATPGGTSAGAEPLTADPEPLPGPEAPEPGAAEPPTGPTGADREKDGTTTAPSGPAIS